MRLQWWIGDAAATKKENYYLLYKKVLNCASGNWGSLTGRFFSIQKLVFIFFFPFSKVGSFISRPSLPASFHSPKQNFDDEESATTV